MPLFYTKKGDGGVSHVGKKKILKTNYFVESLGELDELNSMIGIVRASKIQPRFKLILKEIQENLFIIQANLATLMLNDKHKAPNFSDHKIKEAEKIIDEIELKLKPARKFVISGTTFNSAWLDSLRAKSRRVERSVLGSLRNSKKMDKINPSILPYLNRLSSLFFALARLETKLAGKKEQHPSYK